MRSTFGDTLYVIAEIKGFSFKSQAGQRRPMPRPCISVRSGGLLRLLQRATFSARQNLASQALSQMQCHDGMHPTSRTSPFRYSIFRIPDPATL